MAQILADKVQTRKSRLRVKGLKVRDREKIKEAIAISIQNDNCTTREIGVDLGKDHSTISRYLAEMEREGKWGIKRDANGNIVISLQKHIAQQYRELEKESFNQLPSIQKRITFLKSGGVPASRIRYLLNVIHGISSQLKVMPETIISYGVPIEMNKRKEIAIEYCRISWRGSIPHIRRCKGQTPLMHIEASSQLTASTLHMAKARGTGCQPRRKDWANTRTLC